MHPAGPSDDPCVEERIKLAEQLFSEYGGFIRSVIRFFIHEQTVQEDVYQELFVFFIRKPVPEDVQNIKGFLYRVIADRIKDLKRKQTRYNNRLVKYAESINPSVESDENGVFTVIQREQAEKVYAVLEEYLTENEARAITLRYKHDLDIHETAEVMDVQPKTVSRYVCIGLKKIRDVFKKRERAQHEEGE